MSLTGLLISMEAATLASSPREDNWWMAPNILCPSPALVPAGYAESDITYGGLVDSTVQENHLDLRTMPMGNGS